MAEHRGVVPAPVVDDVVGEIEHGGVLHQRGSRAEVRVQIVVERDVLRGTVAADMLAHETLTDEAPLKGGSIQVGAIPIHLRVRAPRHRAVVEDDVMHSRLGRPIAQEVIAGIVLQVAPHTNAQVADDDVVRAVDEPYAPIALGLPVPPDLHAARRGLSGDGEIGRAHPDRGLQRDRAADAKHDDARAGRFHGIPQASLTRILEIRHLDDSSAAAAHRFGPESLRRRERLDGVRCAGCSEQTRTAHPARDFCSAVAGRAPRGGDASERQRQDKEVDEASPHAPHGILRELK